jgi:single-stranded DNA-binding protein
VSDIEPQPTATPSIHTQQSVSGFIATQPQLTRTNTGESRFFARFAQEHYTRAEDGTFIKGEPTFHDLVAYRATAERAFSRLARGDAFVAEGYARDYQYTDRGGQQITGSEFVAKKLGHDLARTTYDVTRQTRQTPTIERPDITPAVQPPPVNRQAPANTPVALAL